MQDTKGVGDVRDVQVCAVTSDVIMCAWERWEEEAFCSEINFSKISFLGDRRADQVECSKDKFEMFTNFERISELWKCKLKEDESEKDEIDVSGL